MPFRLPKGNADYATGYTSLQEKKKGSQRWRFENQQDISDIECH